LDATFKVKGQGRQTALLSAALTHKAAAAVSVGTYSVWESTATLRLLGGARLGEERVGGILCRHAHSLVSNDSVVVQRRFNSILLSDSFSS